MDSDELLNDNGKKLEAERAERSARQSFECARRRPQVTAATEAHCCNYVSVTAGRRVVAQVAWRRVENEVGSGGSVASKRLPDLIQCEVAMLGIVSAAEL